MKKTFYLFDEFMGEFLGKYDAQESPLEPGSYITPFCSTDIAPPNLAASQVAVFATGEWSVEPDYRGETWYDAQGGAVEIKTLGQPSSDLTREPIPDTEEELLAKAKTTQIDKVAADCGRAIVAGFKSSALGVEHTYPSARDDQTNLIGAVASGLPIIYFWCANAVGLWELREHTVAQIKQVLADAGTHRMAFSAQLAGLVAQINAATTISGVAEIIWS